MKNLSGSSRFRFSPLRDVPTTSLNCEIENDAAMRGDPVDPRRTSTVTPAKNFEAKRNPSESILVEPRTVRGAKDIVYGELPIAARPEAQDERQKLTIVHGSKVDIAVRQFFRPYVLAFLALAIAVGGNGYGYKLAQYFHHSEVSKASATRMWVDHRDDSSITVSHQQTHPQRISAFELFLVFAPQVPRLTRDHALTTPAPARAAFIISSHIPFRAPPSTQSSLA